MTSASAHLTHDAFFYDSEEGFVEALGPFLAAGIAAGEGAVAVTSPSNRRALRDSLGRDAARVRFVDAGEWYRTPARTIAGYKDVLDGFAREGAPRVRVIGEVRFGSTADEHRAWTRYEAILNDVFAESNAWIVCPYDRRALPDDVLEDARRTHPWVFGASDRSRSGTYQDPHALLTAMPPSPAIADGPPAIDEPVTSHLDRVRASVGWLASDAGVGPDRVPDLVIAVNEVAGNALRHGSGDIRLRGWQMPGAVVVEVSDGGGGFQDPVAGFRPPDLARAEDGGMGLWIARQLCDEVAVIPGPRGLTVRLRFLV